MLKRRITTAVVKRICTYNNRFPIGTGIQAIARLGSLGLRLSWPSSGVQCLFRVIKCCVSLSSWAIHLSKAFWSSFFDAVAFVEAAGSTVWTKIGYDCTGDKKNRKFLWLLAWKTPLLLGLAPLTFHLVCLDCSALHLQILTMWLLTVSWQWSSPC